MLRVYSRSIKCLTENPPMWRVTLKTIVKPDLINKGAPLLIFQCGGFGRITTTPLLKTVPLVEQKLLTFPDHMSSPSALSGVRVI